VIVEVPEPFSWELTTERFRAFGPDPANLWEEGRLYRVFDGREIAIEGTPGGVLIEPGDELVAGQVARFLGAEFDLGSFYAFAATEPVLARIVEAIPGLRPPLSPDPFEMLVGAISAQQVSLFAAFAVRARFIRRFGTPCEHVHAFPTRELVATLPPEALAELGFSRRKAEYVIGVAGSELDFEALRVLSDDEVKAAIVSVRGLGEWTADWFLARHLGRPNAWPAGDLGVLKAVSAFYFDGRKVSIDEARAFGERFGEYRNLAAHYLLSGHRVLTP
jgi:DNA-3-methyladenine glycosylase II